MPYQQHNTKKYLVNISHNDDEKVTWTRIIFVRDIHDVLRVAINHYCIDGGKLSLFNTVKIKLLEMEDSDLKSGLI